MPFFLGWVSIWKGEDTRLNLTESRLLETGNGAGDSVASGSVIETNSAVAPSSSLRLVDSSWPPSRTLTGHFKSKLWHSLSENVRINDSKGLPNLLDLCKCYVKLKQLNSSVTLWIWSTLGHKTLRNETAFGSFVKQYLMFYQWVLVTIRVVFKILFT